MKFLALLTLMVSIANAADPEFIWSKKFAGNSDFPVTKISGNLDGYVGATGSSFPMRYINESGGLECHALFRYVNGEFTTTGDIGEVGGNCPQISGATPIRTVEAFGTDICIGGDFTNLGGVANMNFFACYSPTLGWYQPNGTGNGPNSPVHVIEADTNGTGLYVGGAFTFVNTISTPLSAKRIVKTDGLSWTPLYSDDVQTDNGVSATVTSILPTASFVFAGSGNSIMSWNPTIPEWKVRGTHNGSNGVPDMVSTGPVLTAATNQATSVSGDPSGSISDFDIGGEMWSATGSSQGIDIDFGQLLYGLGPLYATGDFTSIDPNAKGLAVFIGDWQAVNNYQQLGDLNLSQVTEMQQGFNDFCMLTQGSPSDSEIFWSRGVCYDGSNWFGMNNSVFSNVTHALAKFQGNIIYGGDFTSAGDARSEFIAQLGDDDRWNPISQLAWTQSGTGYVKYLQKYDGELYATGVFDEANGVSVNQIAKWDGANWSSTMPGFFATNNSPMINWDGKLVVQGFFGGLSSIVTWDGTSIVKLDGFAGATDFEIYDGELIATDGTGEVMRWNGATWEVLINNIQAINSLEVSGSNLYIGGDFNSACSAGDFISAKNIMYWDGVTCHAMGSGIVNNSSVFENVADIKIYNGNVIVTGNFDTAGGVPAAALAYWDGVSWNAMDQGLRGFGSKLFVSENTLYIAGSFKQAGDAIVNNFAKVILILDRVFANGFD